MKLILQILAAAALSLTTVFIHAQTAATASSPGVTRVPVVFSDGYDTDPRDRGRPVILIASALGVTEDVFRDAFSGVRPAGPGKGGPTGDEARANKKVLMTALGKHGVNNERLDEVSNYYRYPPGSRELWKNTPAKANALVQNGVVVGYELIDGGAGYTTAPIASVPSVQGPAPKVELAFGKKFEKNGSVSAITVAK